MPIIRKAGALIIKNKKLLIVKPKGKPYYINPGGKYEQKEDAEACLKREIKEELTSDVSSLKHYKTYKFERAAHSNFPLILELFFVEIVGETVASSEIEKIEWLTKEDFFNKKYNVAPSFFTYIPDLIKDGLL